MYALTNSPIRQASAAPTTPPPTMTTSKGASSSDESEELDVEKEDGDDDDDGAAARGRNAAPLRMTRPATGVTRLRMHSICNLNNDAEFSENKKWVVVIVCNATLFPNTHPVRPRTSEPSLAVGAPALVASHTQRWHCLLAIARPSPPYHPFSNA
jgi:hypothetical protein